MARTVHYGSGRVRLGGEAYFLPIISHIENGVRTARKLPSVLLQATNALGPAQRKCEMLAEHFLHQEFPSPRLDADPHRVEAQRHSNAMAVEASCSVLCWREEADIDTVPPVAAATVSYYADPTNSELLDLLKGTLSNDR